MADAQLAPNYTNVVSRYVHHIKQLAVEAENYTMPSKIPGMQSPLPTIAEWVENIAEIFGGYETSFWVECKWNPQNLILNFEWKIRLDEALARRFDKRRQYLRKGENNFFCLLDWGTKLFYFSFFFICLFLLLWKTLLY